MDSRKGHSSGIVLGRNIISNDIVFWDPNRSISPHVLVVGPTGSGKTETLISIASKLNLASGFTVIFVDVKGDISKRLFDRGYRINYQPIPFRSLDPLYPFFISPDLRIGQIFDTIVAVYNIINPRLQAMLYEVLRSAYDRSYRPSWKSVLEILRSIDSFRYERSHLERVITEISYLDKGSYRYEIRWGDINIVSLEHISKEREEILSFATLMVFQDIINYVSNLNPDTKDIGACIVLDEAWLISRSDLGLTKMLNLLKLSRGYGMSVMIAAQSFQDLGKYVSRYIDNVGLLLMMGNPNKYFWVSASRFVKLDRKILTEQALRLGRGEAIIRIMPKPELIPVSLDLDIDTDKNAGAI